MLHAELRVKHLNRRLGDGPGNQPADDEVGLLVHVVSCLAHAPGL